MNSVSRIAKGIIVLRNIDVNVKYTHMEFQPFNLAQLDSSPILLRNTEEQKATFSAHTSRRATSVATLRTVVMPMAQTYY